MVYFQDCLDSGVISKWLTKKQTTVMQKVKGKDIIESNYMPVKCLSLFWESLIVPFASKAPEYLQSWTKCMRQTLIFLWNSAIWENFNFYFPPVFY